MRPRRCGLGWSDCGALILLNDLRIAHMGWERTGVQHMAYVHSIALPFAFFGAGVRLVFRMITQLIYLYPFLYACMRVFLFFLGSKFILYSAFEPPASLLAFLIH